MPAPLDAAQTRRIARLARLQLSDAEVETLTPQLQRILEYVESLAKLRVNDVEPMTHAVLVQDVLREDAPRPSLDVEAALANAPERQGDYFRVPTVLDANSGA